MRFSSIPYMDERILKLRSIILRPYEAGRHEGPKSAQNISTIELFGAVTRDYDFKKAAETLRTLCITS